MVRTTVVLVTVLTLAMVPSLGAQAKQKDPVLQQYLKDELDQKQSALDAEIRNEQNISKSIDTSLSTLRLSSQQDLFSLKTDLAQARQDLSAVADLVRKSSASAAAPVAAPAPAAPLKAVEPPA